jgi:hypothetical protein
MRHPHAFAAALVAAVASSAVAAQSAGAPSIPWPGYIPKMFRWDEDYRSLRDQAGRAFLPYRLKYIPLGGHGDRYLSLGGEYRFRVDRYDSPDFGLHNAPGFSSVQQRFLLHADLHLDPAVRVFVQLGGAAENGREPFARPADHSRADIAQGFVELNVAPGGEPWRVRLGRQEVAIGRYVAIRDSTNIRRTFDGVRLDGGLGTWTLTGLAARATRNLPRAFDDDPDPHDEVFLVMAEHPLPWSGFKADVLAIERDNYLARYAAGVGVERRRSLGVRVFGAAGGWDADGQVSYQFGRFAPVAAARLDIRSWGAAFEGGRTLNARWKPRLALRVDAAGGDNNPRDNRLATFDLPYPNLSYLTDAAIFSPRNVHDLHPFASITPLQDLTLTLGTQFLWRNTRNDSVYSAVYFPVIPPGGRGLYVTTEPYLRVNWRFVPLAEFQGGIVHAMPGAALRSFGATQRLDFAFASLALRF